MLIHIHGSFHWAQFSSSRAGFAEGSGKFLTVISVTVPPASWHGSPGSKAITQAAPVPHDFFHTCLCRPPLGQSAHQDTTSLRCSPTLTSLSHLRLKLSMHLSVLPLRGLYSCISSPSVIHPSFPRHCLFRMEIFSSINDYKVGQFQVP